MTFISFCLSCTAGRHLKVPPYSCTRGFSFIRRPFFCLHTDNKRLIPLTHLCSYFGPPCCCLGLGTTSEKILEDDMGEEKIQEEYCEWCSIVSTSPKPKTNTRYVTKSSGLGSSSGVPLGTSVSAKALVFQYTVTETADAVGKCLCRARPKPLDSVSLLTSTQVPQVLRVGPVFCSLCANHDTGPQWPQTQTVIVTESHKQACTHKGAHTLSVTPLPLHREHPNGM